MDASIARSRPADSMTQACLWVLLPALVLFLVTPSVGNAQVPVVTDITSSGLGTEVQPPSDGVYNITGGTRPGGGLNLFHSFGDFSIGQGDVANFLNDSGLPTSNIIGRITGGISNIDGTIQTNDIVGGFGNANLFLINPSGIVFGPHGSFNVGGSVSFSTAQYLRLFDGVDSANFYANPASDGLANSILVVDPVVNFGFLASAAPAAYGFLTAPDPNASVTVQGSALSVDPGQSISLVGREVVIQGATFPDGTRQPAHLSAPDGSILLASAASPGEFDVATLQALPNVDGVSGVSFTSFGSVSLALGSSIDVHGTSTVFVKGGQLVLSVKDATLTTTSDSSADSDTISLSPGSSITTSNSGAEPGADVQITVGNLQLDGATVKTINFGDGDGGNISINSTTVRLSNFASVGSSTGFNPNPFVVGGSGDGGDVTVQGLQGAGSAASSVTLINGATISTLTAFGPGSGGDVDITAGTLLIENLSEVSTDTSVGSGAGGSLSLNVETLTLKGGDFGGSKIRTTDLTGIDVDGDGVADGGIGQGGNVTITVKGVDGDTMVLLGGSQIVSESAGGDGGGLSITAKSLILDDASTIYSSATQLGDGGDIVVSVEDAEFLAGATIASYTSLSGLDAGAAGTITVRGLKGDGFSADSLTLDGYRSGIISESLGPGLPGDIELHAKTVSLTNRAVIEGGTQQSFGTGGNVNIVADSVSISSSISSSIFELSHISSQAFALAAGQVTIKADRLTLDNGTILTSTASEFGGRGGDVVLDIGTVSLTNGASIKSQSEIFSTGRAGNITMTGGSLTLANQSEITSSSEGIKPDAGDAGNLTITLSGAFTSNGSAIATTAENAKGGDILIDAQNVQLSNGTVISASSNAPFSPGGEGNAGNITIISASNIIMQNSSVTTEASAASGGDIEIDASDTGMIQLANSRVSTSVGGVAKQSNGGNITIDPQFVILQNSQIRANAVAGAGGAIDIIATSAFIKDPASIVSASSTLGISGIVNIQSPLQNIGEEATPLSEEFSSAAALLAQHCAARAAGGTFSTFVVAAREGLPVEPGGFLASPSLTSELLGARFSGRDPQTQFSAVTGPFPKNDARPIQLAKLGNTCR